MPPAVPDFPCDAAGVLFSARGSPQEGVCVRIVVGRSLIATILVIVFLIGRVPGATLPQSLLQSAGSDGPAKFRLASAMPNLLIPTWSRLAQTSPAPPSPTPPPQTPPPTTPTPAQTPAPTTPPPQTPTPAPSAPTPTPAPPAQPPQRVAGIEVRGNVRVPTDQILAVVQTRVGEDVNDEKVRTDVRAILDLGTFADVNARVEHMEGGVRLIFIVIENPIVSEIIVEGNTVISTEEIIAALGVPIGQVLNFTTMRAGARAVEKVYEGKGYVLARVTDLSIIPTEAGGGRLRIRVGEGSIEAIRFDGLTKTRDVVVRRQLRVKPGDVFNITLLNKDLQRIFDLGLFESVRAQPRPGSTTDTAVIVIEVKEARTGQIGFGIGYSDVYGLLGGVEFRDRNWQGLGQTLVVRADRSIQSGNTTFFNYEIALTEPWLSDTDALDLSLFSSTSTETEYTGGSPSARFQLQRTGAIAQVTRRFSPTTSLSARLRSEQDDITALQLNPPDPYSPLPSFFSPGRVVSIALAYTQDTRNDRFTPTAGSKIIVGTEFALTQLGSNFSFVKYTGEYTQFFPIGSASTIVARIAGATSSGQLPLQEQFTLGGPSTIRAYPGGRFRADTYVLTNLEFRFPLGQIFEWLGEMQGIVFADVGIYRPVTVGSTAFSSPVGGYGVGIAVKTPVGPFRIDFAFGPEGRQTWLSLGAPF